MRSTVSTVWGLFVAMHLSLGAPAALAETTWTDLRSELYGDRTPALAPEIVRLDAPYRTMTDPRTVIGAEVKAPAGEFLTRVTLFIDENPMPVSAVFDLAEPQRRFAFTGTMRINGPTPVHVVAETDRGGLYMAEGFVKTSGVGACAAPPGTDPDVALATLGQMRLRVAPGSALEALTGALPQSGVEPRRLAELDLDHPSHSGMQMDQISLLFIPARYIETVAVDADGRPLFRMTGSISFSENPTIGFEVPEGSIGLDVEMTDTGGDLFRKSFPLDGG